jgi:hypothetical protein
MKVFYSWQSDTPNNVGRTFIRKALDAALNSLQLDEAERPVVDQDTADVLGSPVIADTIFRKIREAVVIVADVTLTGQTSDGKRLINSNVAIELGYAIGNRGDSVLLKVMNTHYGLPDELPFDLKHRRWPVQFKLSPNAILQERRSEREALIRSFRQILQSYLETYRPLKEAFVPTPSTLNSASYWQREESFFPNSGRHESTEELLRYSSGQPLMYLRIWPRKKINPLAINTLADYEKSAIEPLGGGGGAWAAGRNKYGVLSHRSYDSESTLASTTQVFRSGEIWGVNAYRLRSRPGYPNCVPTQAFEADLHQSLRQYLNVARTHFGYPPVIAVEGGLVSVENFVLSMPHTFSGPIFEDVKITTEVDMEAPESFDRALLTIFIGIFEAAGEIRPENLYNFPPVKSQSW